MILRKYSIYKVIHLVEGGELYMVYLGDNKFGLGKSCNLLNLIALKKEIKKRKTNPLYISVYLTPKEFNSTDKVEVISIITLKNIPTAHPSFETPSFVPPYPSKPKKDYSKMRILNRDS